MNNSKWIKIKDKEFLAKEISVQYNIDGYNHQYNRFTNKHARIATTQPGRSCDITIVLDISLQKESYKFITDLYDNQFGISGRSGYANDYKFNISCANFIANGTYFKSIDIDTNGLVTLGITSDYATLVPLDERRDQIIDEILNETSNNKNV
jgi:hypothetical protein